MPEATVTDMMMAYVQDAIDYARDTHQINLDYSEESVEEIEKILEVLHQTLPKSFLGKLFRRGPSPENIEQVCKMFGGYIGEVARRHLGGEWTLESPISLDPMITLHISGINTFPPTKVYKRLTNGEEDNVWFYYLVLKEQIQKQEESENASI